MKWTVCLVYLNNMGEIVPHKFETREKAIEYREGILTERQCFDVHLIYLEADGSMYSEFLP